MRLVDRWNTVWCNFVNVLNSFVLFHRNWLLYSFVSFHRNRLNHDIFCFSFIFLCSQMVTWATAILLVKIFYKWHLLFWLTCLWIISSILTNLFMNDMLYFDYNPFVFVLQLWDIRDGMCKQTFSGHESDINAITVSIVLFLLLLNLFGTYLDTWLQKDFDMLLFTNFDDKISSKPCVRLISATAFKL